MSAYDAAIAELRAVAAAIASQAAFDAAADVFETARSTFLDKARATLQAPVSDDKEI